MLLLLALAFFVQAAAAISTSDCQRVSARGSEQYYLGNDLRFRFQVNASYVVVAGLNGGGTVSLVSCQDPTLYLRVAGTTVQFARTANMTQTFAQQASFNLREDIWFAGYFFLQLASSTTTYVVASGFTLGARQYVNTDIFREQASFQFDPPASESLAITTCAGFESVSQPTYSWTQQGGLGLFSTDTFLPVASSRFRGLVNLLSCQQNNSYVSAFANGTVAVGPVNISLPQTLFSLSLTRFNSPGFATFLLNGRANVYLAAGRSRNSRPILTTVNLTGAVLNSQYSTACFLPVQPETTPDNTTNTTTPSTPLLPPTVGRWVFFSSNGSAIVDAVGNETARPATATLAKKVNTCVFGSCLAFANASYTIASPLLLRANFTFSFWALPTAAAPLFTSGSGSSPNVASSTFPFLISQSAATLQALRAGVCAMSVAVVLNGIAVLAQRTGVTIPVLMYSRPTPAYTWNLYTLSVNDSIVSLYIDDKLVAVGSEPSGCDLIWYPTTLGVGRTSRAVTGYYQGQLDEMLLYNTSLSTTDVSASYTIAIDNARQCFSMLPTDYPSYHVEVQANSSVIVAAITTDTFKLVPGLNGAQNTVSILSCIAANRYLTIIPTFYTGGVAVVSLLTYNSNQRALLATFTRTPNLFVNGSSSYESYRYPGFYLRHRGATGNFRMVIERVDDTSSDALQQSASFTRVFTQGLVFANTPCNGKTTYGTDMGMWHFDEGYGTVVNDQSYLGNDGTLVNGVRWTIGKIGLGLSFNPNNSTTSCTTDPRNCPIVSFNRPSVLATSSFSFSLWAAAAVNATHQIDAQSNTGTQGTSGQRYAIFPTQATQDLDNAAIASIGVSIGSNGVTVYAHAAYYMPPLLVWQGDMTSWTFVTVVVNNSWVSLYLNGTFVKTGVYPTGYTLVYSLYTVGSGWYGAYWGKLDELRLFDYPLTATNIRSAYNADMAASQSACATGRTASTTLTCPTGKVVFAIESAAFASATSNCSSFRRSSCNAPPSLAAINNACAARSTCVVNLASSDPCPTVNKTLRVDYICTNPAPSTTTCLAGTAGAAVMNLRCPSGVISSFTFASYGRPTGGCGSFVAGNNCKVDVRATLASTCLGRTSCSVLASQLQRPNCPNPQTNFRLNAQFTCNTAVLPIDSCAQAPNNTMLTITCPATTVVTDITFASFGTPSGTCGAWSTQPACHAATTEATLTAQCVGKQSCSVLASPAVFQLPATGCAGGLWLKAQYTCSPAISSASVCKTVLSCTSGLYEVTPPTPYSDRVCAPCLTGTFKASNNTDVDCSPITPCGVGSYQTAPATTKSDIACAPLAQCLARQYISVPSTSTSNRLCANCSACPANATRAACTATTDTVCTNCSRACTPLVQYQVADCSRSSDRVCNNCSTCNATQYLAASCTANRDTLCLPRGSCSSAQYTVAPSTATSAVVCGNLTVCINGTQFQSVPPTNVSDRTCATFLECNSGEYTLIEPTATSDRVCAQCAAGTALNATTQSCVTCSPGQFIPVGSESCNGVPCAPGTTDLNGNAASQCTPCPFGQTQPLAGQSGPCLNITVCLAGQYQLTAGTPVQQTVCSACPVGTFSNTSGVTACTPVTSCQPGTMQALGGAPTATSDRLCMPCSPGTFSSMADTACGRARDCLPGTGVSVLPTATSDRVCQSCTLGVSFSATNNGVCTNLTACSNSSFFISTPATLSSDQACSLADGCVAGSTFELSAPTATTNRVCSNCSACSASRFAQTPCTVTSDTVCSNCVACAVGLQYIAAPCSATTNGTCLPCKTCAPGEFLSSSCTAQADAVCVAFAKCGINQFQSTAPTSSSDRLCTNYSTCDSGQYEAVPTTTTTDRVCLTTTQCQAYEVAQTAQTATSDRVCVSCSANQTVVNGVCVDCGPGTSVPAMASQSCAAYACQPGTYSTSPANACTTCDGSSYQPSGGASSCLPATVCAAGTQLDTPLTTVVDRTCAPCPANTFKPLPGETLLCAAVTICPSGYFSIAEPTPTTDRNCSMCPAGTFKSAPGSVGCLSVSVCQPGQAQTSLPTTSTDTVCTTCTAGSYDASGAGSDRVCQSCPSGTYIPANSTGPCQQCLPGTADLDLSPASPCETCPSNTLQTLAGQTACVAPSPCTGTNGMSVAPTLTSDRVCVACSSGVFFSSTVSAQLCAQTCSVNTFELTAPSTNSDRVCAFSVVAVLAVDFALLGSNTSATSTGLRTNLTNTFTAAGVPAASLLQITFTPGSTVANVAVADSNSAELLRQLIANGTLTVNFQGAAVGVASPAPSIAASRSTSSGASAVMALVAIIAIIAAVLLGVFIYRRSRKSRHPITVGQEGSAANDSRNLSFTNPIYDEGTGVHNSSASAYMDVPGFGANPVSPSYGDHNPYAVPGGPGPRLSVNNPLYDIANAMDAGAMPGDEVEYMEASALAPVRGWPGPRGHDDPGYMDVHGDGHLRKDDGEDAGYVDVHGAGATGMHAARAFARRDGNDDMGAGYVDVHGVTRDAVTDDADTAGEGEGPFFGPASSEPVEDVGYVEFAGAKDHEEEPAMA